ncbi:MAG: efflux RND transporter periplasmic adaptor subunit [Epsilonproteobacteria bacterium]|nr:MAG: efflux RND transporter periplasmic adaptor subunit [Campylobacterota bacterium]
MKKIRLVNAVLVVTLFLSATAVFSGAPPAKGERAKMPTPKADIYIIPPPTDLAITLKYPATVKAYKKIQVVARALGILEKKGFTEGQKVNKGELLYEIEDDIYLAQLEAAKASLEISNANLNNATREWKRIKKLFSQKVVSIEHRDTSISAYEQALATVSLAKAELKQTQINLAYTKVKAPISGITGLKLLDIGDFVTNNPPSKLLEITQNDKVYVEFSAPMSDYKKIKNHTWIIKDNAPVKVTLEVDGKAIKKEGVVDFIDVNTNNQTAIVKMRALFDNSDNLLMPGQFVRVLTNNIIQKNIITIPQKAVLQKPLGTIVFIADQGHVSVRPVVLGNVSGDKFIVAGGPLKSGDKVIVNNFFRLKPGGEVVVDKIINPQGK